MMFIKVKFFKTLLLRFLCLIVGLMVGLSLAQEARPDAWATPITAQNLENFYKIDDKLYRSEQPLQNAMQELQSLGIPNLLNLRFFHNNDDEAAGTNLNLLHVRMDPYNISDAAVISALRAIQRTNGPVVVHCWRGADRTGLVVAMYRLLYQDWTKEEAIDELVNGGYGFHAGSFPNIVNYIEEVNVTEIRAKVEK